MLAEFELRVAMRLEHLRIVEWRTKEVYTVEVLEPGLRRSPCRYGNAGNVLTQHRNSAHAEAAFRRRLFPAAGERGRPRDRVADLN